jgi:hypothetical protein
MHLRAIWPLAVLLRLQLQSLVLNRKQLVIQ